MDLIETVALTFLYKHNQDLAFKWFLGVTYNVKMVQE